jgi:hypothetical protein
MRTVEVSRFVRATRREVERMLAPETILEYEGTFTAVDVDESGDETVVLARAGGRLMEARFVFEERQDGYAYRQDGEAGPFEEMQTVLTVEPEDEGVRVTMRSSVSLALPLPLADRVGAGVDRDDRARTDGGGRGPGPAVCPLETEARATPSPCSQPKARRRPVASLRGVPRAVCRRGCGPNVGRLTDVRDSPP